MGGESFDMHELTRDDRARFGLSTLLALALAGWMLAGPVRSIEAYVIVADLLTLAMLLSAIWSAHHGYPSLRVVAALASALATVSIAVSITGDDEAVVRATTAALVASTCLLVPWIVVLSLRTHPRRDLQLVFGAITTYVILGLVFAMAFDLAAAASATPLLRTPEGVADGTTRDHVYMAFVTLSTTGYGDFTPYSGMARAIAIMNALLGQIFLVTAVAAAVSTFASRDRGAR